ncbi:MAG: hypothetical protein JWP59_3599 [Massilia sp.]|nr:hypothetical protein [Massilia sp.]
MTMPTSPLLDVCAAPPLSGQGAGRGRQRIFARQYESLGHGSASSFGLPPDLFIIDNDAACVYNQNAAGALRSKRLRQYESRWQAGRSLHSNCR